MLCLVCLLCFSWIQIPANAAEMRVQQYCAKLSRLEMYASQFQGNTNELVLEFLNDTNADFVNEVLKQDDSLSVLQEQEQLETGAGPILIKQLCKDIVQKTSSYETSRPGTVAFQTAMDAYLINQTKNSTLSSAISKYYASLTNEKRVKQFVTKYYHPESMHKKSFYDTVKRKSQNAKEIVSYLYQHFPSASAQELRIKNKMKRMGIGETISLETEVSPWNVKYQNVSYTSSNASIASITKDGKVVGKKAGTVTIWVSYRGITDSFSLRVCQTVTQMEDLTKEDEILVGKSVTMKFKLSPSNATMQDLEFSSSDEGIATVDNLGKVTTKSPGYVTIQAKSQNGTYLEHKFRVYQKLTSIKAPNQVTLISGKAQKMSYTIFPLGITDQNVVFQSSDEDIVSVSEDGMLYPKKNGTTQVVVHSKKAADIYAVTNVTVITKMKEIIPKKNQSYYMGYPEKFRYKTNPATTSNKTLKYSMKKNEYASITKDGKIIPKKIGQAMLTVRSTDGTNLKKNLTIYIEQMVEKITVKKKVYLKKGESFQLYYTIEPVNATKKAITLTSSNLKKVGIKGGKVVAKGYGSSKITITANDPNHKSTTCMVVVKRPLWHFLVFGGMLLAFGYLVIRKRK